mmetsp:Transcript_124318/g.247847  ORF Transcript_124318/g.247847 Transcript_124318/m.247847 type:complete len:795 (+) Transcript_124318:150-2534(+)
MKTTLPTSRKLCSTNRAANSALSKHIQASTEAASNSSQDMVRITIECEESDIITDTGSEKYFANINVLLNMPKYREISVQGPQRDTKAEAVKDGEVLGKAFQLEGETGVKRVAQRLERKHWTKQELIGTAESSLEGLLVDPRAATGVKQEKLIPPGEGWTRSNDELLWDPRSQVYFAQLGARMGQYMMRDEKTGQFKEVDTPHNCAEFPIGARAGGGSSVRRGVKLERTVLLNELPKIARLALKFPLSFVDSPASAYALFQGLRSSEAADWCAKNFHTKLIPMLASKIHTWETKPLQDALGRVLSELDMELLKSSSAFSGCSALVALLLGDRLVISGVGQVRAVLLFEDGSSRQLLAGTSDFRTGSERERVEEALGIVHNGLLHQSLPEGLHDAQRILKARHNFEVLQIEPGGPADEKAVRTAYRKLALRVHPDKRAEDTDLEDFNKAFSRLESAKEAIENMLSADAEGCRELHRVLRTEVHVRDGAAELLGVDRMATTDTEQVTEEAEKAAKKLIKSLEKLEGVVSADYKLAVAICNEAIETMRRANSPEALPRQEALLRLGFASSRALGARDLRFPSPIVTMKPESTSWHVPMNANCRVAMLCGAATELLNERLVSSTVKLRRCPKAAALRWCLDAHSSASSVGAVCINFESKRKKEEAGPAAKRQKTTLYGKQQEGTIFLRHILFRHQQLRAPDPAARRDGQAKSPGEAEAAALGALERLLAAPNSFPKVCRELSDCQSAEQPGNLVGHLGWISKGEHEAGLDETAFAMEPNEFSDIVTTSRGVHILQRLG